MLLTAFHLILCFCLAYGQEKLLVSGYNNEMNIYCCSDSNHSMSKAAAWPVDTNLTWLQLPSSGWLGPGHDLYAVHEVSFYSPGQNASGRAGGAVSRWTYGGGSITRQEWVSVGKGPAHLLVDSRPQYGGFAYTANYGDGTWSVVSLDQGTGRLGKNIKTWNYTTSSCPRGSHPHNTVVWGSHIWVVDLGCDMIHHHWWTGSVLWEGNSTSVGQGRGPRHMVLHPWRNIAFVVCELQNYLDVYEFDTKYGKMTKLQEVALTSQTTNAGAEIVLVDTGLDLNIYVSSRGVGIIEFFKMKGTEDKVTKEQEFLLVGTWPRHMTLHPSKMLLAVGDQKRNSVELVNIDSETGHLSAGTIIQHRDGPKQPSFLAFFQTWEV